MIRCLRTRLTIDNHSAEIICDMPHALQQSARQDARGRRVGHGRVAPSLASLGGQSTVAECLRRGFLAKYLSVEKKYFRTLEPVFRRLRAHSSARHSSLTISVRVLWRRYNPRVVCYGVAPSRVDESCTAAV
jgi:hypothetical protein